MYSFFFVYYNLYLRFVVVVIVGVVSGFGMPLRIIVLVYFLLRCVCLCMLGLNTVWDVACCGLAPHLFLLLLLF